MIAWLCRWWRWWFSRTPIPFEHIAETDPRHDEGGMGWDDDD